MTLLTLLDNITHLLGDDLKRTLTQGAKLRVAASCFSIYAYEALKAELERVDSVEFIFTSPTFVANEVADKLRKEHREFHIPKLERERGLYGSEFEVRLRNELTQKAIARECADWIRRKAAFRSNKGRAPMQQFACVTGPENAAYMPLHGFTAVDLGYEKGNAVSNFVNKFDEQPMTGTWLALFEQIWSDKEKLEDVTDRLCEHIASVYQENSPQRIYFLILHQIFSEFLEDISADVLPNDLTGYQDSLIWNKLFNFQRDAATGIINKLETYNGCILADSVGLGKTFTALAVVKYYELRNKSVLVLCPKKLADNWLNYNRNLVTNLFAKDRFNYDVLCHTDLLRTRGESLGIPLNRVNWGNYDLVVIDESHNFRNNTPGEEERESRYQRLMNQVIRQGVKTKVLTSGYLYLESIRVSPTKPPQAVVEFEAMQGQGIQRQRKVLGKGDDLYALSGRLEQYREGYVISEINANEHTVGFTNGVVAHVGEALGDVNELTLRRIQIREAVKAHFEKEQRLFSKGIKVLSLFFIDEVAKYRQYTADGELPGEYATIFEEEYNLRLNEVLTLDDTPYNRYLRGIQAARTHNGYFSQDKKTKRFIDSKAAARGETAGEADDVDAYDLILKDKERLLSLDEPVRFIFSHSALREGWDNPNVFVICTLKHSDNTVSRRQEVGRGMRLCVNSDGERVDDPAIVHQVNVLTVVASESYKDFVAGLQSDISKSISSRPREANAGYFKGKLLETEQGKVEVTAEMAKLIERYLVKNDYTDTDDHITSVYHEAKEKNDRAPLPKELEPYKDQVFALIDTVFSDADIPPPDNEFTFQENKLNANFEKKEFQELWGRINHKAVYSVHFDSEELIAKSIKAIDKDLVISPLHYTVTGGEQKDETSYDELKQGDGFVVRENRTEKLAASAHSAVKYDLIGKIASATVLTRRTVSRILSGINVAVFGQYKRNPEDFILKVAAIIKDQKGSVVIEHLEYDMTTGIHEMPDIFTQRKEDLSKGFKARHHIYDYVFTDSTVERNFVGDLDASAEVVVYAKLPKTFFIPTPVGNYNPDWAIAFKQGEVKHVYFIAETKGDLSSLQLRDIEKSKIACARKFFAKITNEQVRYEAVDGYGTLMQLVK